MLNEKTRIILDLRGLVRHCFYSDVEETVAGADGKRVPSAANAVSNFVRMYLQPILQRHQPIDIIGVLEGTDGNARRRLLLPEYKARPEQDATDPIVTDQKQKTDEAVQSLLLALGAVLVKTPYCEADDTIAYLCERLPEGKIIYTVDNDLLVLTSPSVSVLVKGKYTTSYKGKGDIEPMDFESVPVQLLTLYKSIVGDPSDGYVGVRGMGEKAWTGLVTKYGYSGMLQLYDAVAAADMSQIEDSIKNEHCPLLQKLVENRDSWRLSWHLARLHPEWCELSHGERVVRPQWAKRLPTDERLKRILDPLGLYERFYPVFKQYMPVFWLMDAPRLEKTKLSSLLHAMQNSRLVAFDWETYDCLKHQAYNEASRKGNYVDVLNSKLTGGSFCFGSNLQYTFYVPVKHRDTHNVSKDVLKSLLTELRSQLLVAQNASFEITVAKCDLDYDFPVDNPPQDTRLMVSHVDENEDAHLKRMSKHWLNYDQTEYKDVVGEGDMRDVSGHEVMKYGCDDSYVCAHLTVLFNTIMQCERTWDFMYENEAYFDAAVVPGFIAGTPIDYEQMKKLEVEDAALQEKLDIEIRALLTEHCSEISQSGYETLFPEVESFQRALMGSKEKTPEQIEERIQELREEYQRDCKYNPLQPPPIKLDRTTLSAVARAVEFPALRGFTRAWVESKYIPGLHTQLAEQQAVHPELNYTDAQLQFLTLLEGVLPYWNVLSGVKENEPSVPDELTALLEFCTSIISGDKTSWVGDELNIGSSLQMAKLFYGKMSLPILIRNISKDGEDQRSLFDLEGAPSTNEIAIRTWLTTLPETDWRAQILEKVLIVRGIRTRFSLYFKPYPLWRSPIDGRIHPQIKNCGTITHRPSGSSPNTLQITKKDEGAMRSCFLPLTADKRVEKFEDEHLAVSLDFVQQELLIMGAAAQCSALLSCYMGNNRRDVHTSTGTTIINVERKRKGLSLLDYTSFNELVKAKDKTADRIRKKWAKNTNFLAAYMGTASGLARKIILPHDIAESFLNAFYSTFPGVGPWQEEVIRFARKHGFVTTMFGSRKHCKGIFDKNKAIRAAWERQSVNMLIQGCAADVLKIVQRAIVREEIMRKHGAVLLYPVYDEIFASVPAGNTLAYIRDMERVMAVKLPTAPIAPTLLTSVSVGRTWGTQIELGEKPSDGLVLATLIKLKAEWEPHYEH